MRVCVVFKCKKERRARGRYRQKYIEIENVCFRVCVCEKENFISDKIELKSLFGTKPAKLK